MARHSSVYSLGGELRDDLLAKWRSGQYTLDQLAELAGGKISRSALQRYLHTSDQLYQEHRRLQDAANVWCVKLGEDPGGDIGRLCQEMLRVLAHSQIRRLNSENAEQIEPNDVATLARALKDIELASSLGVARETKLREHGEAGKPVAEARNRIDPDLLERVKELVRGRLE
jgi:hypothetical protein